MHFIRNQPKIQFIEILYNKLIKKDFASNLTTICIDQSYKIHAMDVVENQVHLFLNSVQSTLYQLQFNI
jgi:putative transposase